MDKCLVYWDDTVAFSTGFEIAIANLEAVLDWLRCAKLRPKKCELFPQRVEYLGHISAEGVQPTPVKVNAILHGAAPTNLTELRAFLGLTSYFDGFFPVTAT